MIIGLAAPGGYYSPFVHNYFDYVSWIKRALMHGTSAFFKLLKIPTILGNNFSVRVPGGKGVIIAMDCVGYGVYSFWIAFVAANRGTLTRKLIWIFGGLLALYLINVLRISLYLLALNNGWPMPLGLDHHTWFNIFAYLLIFIMIYLYDKKNPSYLIKKNIQQHLIKENTK